MKNVTIQNFAYFAIRNQSCYTFIDAMLTGVESIEDESIMAVNNTLDVLFETLKNNGYRLCFTKSVLKSFAKNTLVSLSVEYRRIKLGQKFGWENESFESHCRNKAAAHIPMTKG